MRLFIKFLYYLKRDILIWKSYKMQAILGILGGFFGLLQFGFMGRFLAQGNYFSLIDQYGGNIIAYFISGSVFMGYTSITLNIFSSVIREEQMMGTIEYLFLSETSLWEVFLFTMLSRLAFQILETIIIFTFLIYTFGIKIQANIVASILILLLTMVSLSGIGLASAGFIMLSKRGDPVSWIYSLLAGMFSGVYYPVEVLPKWLRGISYVLPTTYAMDAIRKTLIRGYCIYEVKQDIVILLLVTIIMLPTGILWFKISFDKSRKSGTLTQY